MAIIDLKDIEIGQELGGNSLVVRVGKHISIEKLEWLNSKSVAGFDIRIQLNFSK